jgi:hypothetical protein
MPQSAMLATPVPLPPRLPQAARPIIYASGPPHIKA